MAKKAARKGSTKAQAHEPLAIEILSPDELDRLLKACSPRAPSGSRDRALLAVLAGAGLRLGEALALLPRDVDADKCVINVRRGKGSKQRIVGIDSGCACILGQWLAARKKLAPPARSPLFCQITTGKLGQPLAQANVRQMLARRQKRAGIEKRTHAHGLRHLRASTMAMQGIPLVLIQRQLGHANAATTNVYLRKIAPEDVIEATRNAPVLPIGGRG